MHANLLVHTHTKAHTHAHIAPTHTHRHTLRKSRKHEKTITKHSLFNYFACHFWFSVEKYRYYFSFLVKLMKKVSEYFFHIWQLLPSLLILEFLPFKNDGEIHCNNWLLATGILEGYNVPGIMLFPKLLCIFIELQLCNQVEINAPQAGYHCGSLLRDINPA